MLEGNYSVPWAANIQDWLYKVSLQGLVSIKRDAVTYATAGCSLSNYVFS